MVRAETALRISDTQTRLTVNYEIKHTGKITETDSVRQTATVALTNENVSDCAGCAVRSLCHTESKSGSTIYITVSTSGFPQQLKAGMLVEIGITAAGRYRALITALGIPCLLLAATAIGLPAAGISQELSAISAIGITATYYTMLYLLRNHIQARYKWQIIKISGNAE